MLEKTQTPAYRHLRGYAFDPSLSLQTDTVEVNKIVYKVEWEIFDTFDDVKAPSGEYIEIIDYDPASQVFYPPVNLDDPNLLAQDGLEPSVSNPQFHQQMVYAVVMTTIKNFERALGRKILWSDRIFSADVKIKGKATKRTQSGFISKLRIYPHALRQANAYYHPGKKAILFGYFPARPANPALKLPGGTVFTCLSHDIIAHETTHAILDGLHRRYIEPTHADTRAFHEAFADIVALFQHFTFPEVLKHQISKTRGNLASQNLLGQLALEFGRALGNYGSLRDAIGHTDPQTNGWIPHKPDPNEYQLKTEFHDRGAILVAAVFDAFLTIYKQRIQSLLRIATGGTGILPDGELHPDLVDNLAQIASKTASTILNMCVRAIDFCPPIDVTFGDYLRAILTADLDMIADDERNYRVAFIEAFQKRGIYPTGLKSMSVEVLCYRKYPALNATISEDIFVGFLREYKQAMAYISSRERIHNLTKQFIGGGPEVTMSMHQRINIKFLRGEEGKRFSEVTGLMFPDTKQDCEQAGLEYARGTARFEIGNVWLANRVSPDGAIVNDVIITILQKRGVLVNIDDEGNFSVAGYFVPDGKARKNGFVFRGGCTLIFDLTKKCLKYAIKKDINDAARMEFQYRYVNKLERDSPTYFSDKGLSALSGPFAFMHSHQHNSYE